MCTNYILKRIQIFKGKVHILGHSLGSAIAFDILSKQSSSLDGPLKIDKDLAFDVNSLFLVGSPVGMFKLLEEEYCGKRLQVLYPHKMILSFP